MEYKKLPPKFKVKWLKALRSGKYKQAYNTLFNPSSDSYCCLGVGCRILNIPKSHLKKRSYPWRSDFKRLPNYFDRANPDVRRWMSTLAEMNDGVSRPKNSFKQIANFIEKHL